MSRWLFFLFMILVGLGVGLLYTWRINPIDYTETDFDTLRTDYQADYVLMVAEIYNRENDLDAAIRRLTRLTLSSSDDTVAEAIMFGEKQGYQQRDLTMLRVLYIDLSAQSPVLETPYP